MVLRKKLQFYVIKLLSCLPYRVGKLVTNQLINYTKLKPNDKSIDC